MRENGAISNLHRQSLRIFHVERSRDNPVAQLRIMPSAFARLHRNDGRITRSSHLKAFAKIQLAADGIVDQKIFRAFAFDTAFENQIGAVDDREGFANIMIGDQNSEAGLRRLTTICWTS